MIDSTKDEKGMNENWKNIKQFAKSVYNFTTQPIPHFKKILVINFVITAFLIALPSMLGWELPFAGNLVDTIHNSIPYKMAAMCLIGLTLPLLLETFFDCFQTIEETTDLLDRSIHVLMFGCIPMIVLILSNNDLLQPAQYWLFDGLQAVLLATTVGHGLLCVKSTVSIVPNSLCLLWVISLSFYNITGYYWYFFLADEVVLTFQDIFYYLDITCFLLILLLWPSTLIWRLWKEKWRKLHFDEFRAVVYLFAFVQLQIGRTVVSVIVGAWGASDDTSYDAETFLVANLIIWTLYALAVTILPGRLSRRMVDKEREMLALKRVFVTNVSKEITSPLYVAHVGLEVLKSELIALVNTIPEKTMKLLDNIYYASDTAMSILNDLLQYENIDTGIFKLDQKILSMKNIFKGRLKPLQYLAAKHQINLIIFDEAEVTEYFKDRKTQDGGSPGLVDVFNSIPDSRLMDISCSLNIDIICLDQMLRNIMYTMVKNTPLDGTITIRFLLRLSESQATVTDIHASKTLTDYLRVEFLYSSSFSEDQQVANFNLSGFDPNKPVNEGDSGMDLWISRKIIDAHKGEINFVCDSNGHNPKFIVDLPIIIQDSDQIVLNISNSNVNSSEPIITDGSMSRSSDDESTKPLYLKRTKSASIERPVIGSSHKVFIENSLQHLLNDVTYQSLPQVNKIVQEVQEEAKVSDHDKEKEKENVNFKSLDGDGGEEQANLKSLDDGDDNLKPVDNNQVIQQENNTVVAKVNNNNNIDPEFNVRKENAIIFTAYSKSHSSFPLYKIPIVSTVPMNLSESDFTEVSFLTSGSCSDIYTAIFQEKPVIVKILKVEYEQHSIANNEFKLELDILIRFSHENIIKVVGAGITPRPLIVLEWLEGGSLADKLSKLMSSKLSSSVHTDKKGFSLLPYDNGNHKNFKEENRLMLGHVLTIARTLKYLHTEAFHGLAIIHRDLKPENIGFTADGALRIFDFGLASAIYRRQNNSDVYQLTGFTGSIRYMAPEVALKQPYSEKVDVFSFGILVWQMLTLETPYTYANKAVIMGRVVLNNERPKIPSEWPTKLKDLLSKCWDLNANTRPDFPTIVSILEDIVQ